MNDSALFVGLVKGHETKFFTITVRADHLNHPGSPVWDAAENAAPLLAMLTISVILIFVIHVLVGLAATVLSVLIYLTIIRSWILKRVYDRAIEAATKNLHNWDLLWKKGGLVLSFNRSKNVRCLSPRDDWRAFAARYLRRQEVDSAELYESIKRAEGAPAEG